MLHIVGSRDRKVQIFHFGSPQYMKGFLVVEYLPSRPEIQKDRDFGYYRNSNSQSEVPVRQSRLGPRNLLNGIK